VFNNTTANKSKSENVRADLRTGREEERRDLARQVNLAVHGVADAGNSGGPAPQSGGNRAQRKATLSKAHIRPFVGQVPRLEYVEGASLLLTTKDKYCQAVGGGRRGMIKGFSQAARRRLLELIACVRLDAVLPLFMTLTYPSKFPTVERAKRDLKVFLQRMERRFPGIGYIWKLEPQLRGAPHYHLLIWGVDLMDLLGWTVQNWYDIAGDGDRNHYLFHAGVLKDSKPCVSKVRSWRGVWSYAAKYLGKTFKVAEWGSQWTGRFWGVGNRENIPFGEVKTVITSEKKVVEVMRYQRRFMAMRGRGNLNSLKTFCLVDYWVSKLHLE
jgi:hypothetical protein